MKAVGRYDSALQMFVEETREPDLRTLTFMRWLVDNDRLEHAVGPSSGKCAEMASKQGLIKEGTRLGTPEQGNQGGNPERSSRR